MNYEKKYKNALEWARQVMSGETGFIRKEVEEVFPELKESEDERVRQVLLDVCKMSISDLWEKRGCKKEQVIAWLEKKAIIEMKSPEESLGIDSDTYNNIVDECIYGEQKPQRMISAEAKEALYGKPTWSEDDERICRNIINDIANEKSMCDFDISKEICDEQINWLKSLRGRYTWRPSDEQMKMLHRAIVGIAPGVLHDGLESLYKDLKNL